MRTVQPVDGQLFILSGPSGVGKSVLARSFVEAVPEAERSVSVTTRPARKSEVEGVDYFFRSEHEFESLRRQGLLAEWARVHGHCYGTLRSEITEVAGKGNTLVMELDPQGAVKVRAQWPEQTVMVYLLPPSWEELTRRLKGRATDTPEEISLRLKNARREIEKGSGYYPYLLVNTDHAQSLARIQAISQYERGTWAGNSQEIERWRNGKGVHVRHWLGENRPPV